MHLMLPTMLVLALAAPVKALEAGVYFVQRGPFVGQQGVWRMGLDGASPTRLFDPGPDSHLMQDIAIHSTLPRAFWMHGTPGFFDVVRASDLDGANQYILDDPFSSWGISESSGDLELDQQLGRVWMLDTFLGRILNVDLDGRHPVVPINAGTASPIAAWAPDFENHSFYFRDGRGTITRAALDGTTLGSFGVSGGPLQMTVDSARGVIYYAPEGTGDLWRVGTDGAADALFIAGAASLNAITDIEIDPVSGAVYWTDWERGTIHRADADGSNIREIFAAPPGVVGFGIDVVVPAPATLVPFALLLRGRRTR